MSAKFNGGSVILAIYLFRERSFQALMFSFMKVSSTLLVVDEGAFAIPCVDHFDSAETSTNHPAKPTHLPSCGAGRLHRTDSDLPSLPF